MAFFGSISDYGIISRVVYLKEELEELQEFYVSIKKKVSSQR